MGPPQDTSSVDNTKKRDPVGTKPKDAYKSKKESRKHTSSSGSRRSKHSSSSIDNNSSSNYNNNIKTTELTKISRSSQDLKPRYPSAGRAREPTGVKKEPQDGVDNGKEPAKDETQDKYGARAHGQSPDMSLREPNRETPYRDSIPRVASNRSANFRNAVSAHARLVGASPNRPAAAARSNRLSNVHRVPSYKPQSEHVLPGGESTPRRSTEDPSIASYNAKTKTGYIPPILSEDSADSTGGDKYRTHQVEKNDKYRTQLDRKESLATTAALSLRQGGTSEGHLRRPVSEMTSQSFESTEADTTNMSSTVYSDFDIQPPSQSALSRRDTRSISSETTYTNLGNDGVWSEEDLFVGKQKFAFVCIGVSSIQLMVLLTQMILCGVASVDVNPMIGPFPDAFSEWGGKNAYLMIEGREYWRIFTPVFLHVGVLHLLVNVFCQLETCAFFERDWGSFKWLVLYVVSGVGSVASSSVTSPDEIGVCSSGALMGLFGAKLAQITSWSFFDLQIGTNYESVKLDHLSGLLCSTAVVSILSFFTYIDFAGHVGGLTTGFLAGMFVFCKPIRSVCARVFWAMLGLIGLLLSGVAVGYMLLYEISPDEELADACNYFRNLFPEGYDCECLWN